MTFVGVQSELTESNQHSFLVQQTKTITDLIQSFCFSLTHLQSKKCIFKSLDHFGAFHLKSGNLEDS